MISETAPAALAQAEKIRIAYGQMLETLERVEANQATMTEIRHAIWLARLAQRGVDRQASTMTGA